MTAHDDDKDSRRDSDIAIVGMAAALPGRAQRPTSSGEPASRASSRCARFRDDELRAAGVLARRAARIRAT